MEFEDTKDIKHIILRVETKEGKVRLFSAFDAWYNIGLLMEALGMQVKMAIKEGVPKEKVYEGVKNYLNKVLLDYDKVWKDYEN